MIQERPSYQSAVNALEFIKKSDKFSLTAIEENLLSKRFSSLQGMSEFLSNVLKGGFPEVDNLENLTGLSKTVARIKQAIENQEFVLIACDYDADGLGAASVLKMGLELLGLKKIEIMISDRYNGGYGFNQKCVEQIVAMKNRPNLVITVDEGSSDEDRISDLKRRAPEIDLIVTDHHHVPEKTPDSAYAFVNPNKHNDPFKHKNICGAVVAFLVIKGINDSLDEKKRIDIKPLLQICAVSTIGDVMPLNDALNRAIVSYGLAKANGSNGLPFWNAVKQEAKVIDEGTIGFNVAPKINAMSRIGEDAMHVINFFTSKDPAVVFEAYQKMSSCNQARKEVNEDLYQLSVSQIEEQKDRFCHVIYLENGLSGVTGIVASRIKEETGKPVICFCPKKDGEGYVTGSGRSIDGVDIRLAVEKIAYNFENSAYGGHPAACGVTLKVDDLKAFYDDLEKEVKEQLNNKYPVKQTLYDFDLDNQFDMGFAFVGAFERLKPFGHKYEKPVSKLSGVIMNARFHENGHIMGQISHKGQPVKFVWFNGKISPEDRNGVKFEQGMSITLVGEIAINEFRGEQSLQVLVDKAIN
jgi:single-stranded-DNA-specific exonuclease